MRPGFLTIIVILAVFAAPGARAGGRLAVKCTVPAAPKITIAPSSQPIAYDFSKTSAQLSQVRTNTSNPFGANVDTATGGLRKDEPMIKMQVKWGIQEWTGGIYCLWYDRIDLEIELRPKIYIAKDFDGKLCRAAVLEHERRHVDVDRQVINAFVKDLGASVRATVDKAGALGPYSGQKEMEIAQKSLVDAIYKVTDYHKNAMQTAMRKEQAKVDTKEEYERVSKICNDEKKTAGHKTRRP